MAKVIKDFYCTQEKKTYKKGDEYTGKRTDLQHVLEAQKKTKVLKPSIKKKPNK
jgi:hypothetical protein